MKKWKILDSRLVFNQPWYKVRQDVVELPDKRVIDDYYVSIRDDFVITFPVVGDNKVLMVTQYKHAIQDFVTEFPAGLINKNEAPEIAAKRELREETGYEARKLTKLAVLAENPSKSTNSMHIYLAQDLKKVGEPELDDDGEGEMEVGTVTFQHLWEMILNGDIATAPMVATGVHALAHLGHIKE